MPVAPDDQISKERGQQPRYGNQRLVQPVEHGRFRAEMHLSHDGHISILRPGQADASQWVDEG